MKYCPKCGTENKEDAEFCKECGAILELAEEAGVRKLVCPNCKREIELKEGDKFCYYCGYNFGIEKANVGERFGSWILDVIIVNVIGGIAGFVLGLWWAVTFPYEEEALEGIASLLGIIISMGYFTYFFGNGQTPGMKVMKIKLCGTDGTYPIRYTRGFLRWVGMIISGVVIGLGYLWILIDENRQGWHDKIAGTYVIESS